MNVAKEQHMDNLMDYTLNILNQKLVRNNQLYLEELLADEPQVGEFTL